MRLDPATGEAAVLSLPRDLLVEVPGGTTTRINATQAVGGLESLISTVDANFDIPVNHFIVADFASFSEVVEIVGGVPVNFPFPTRDRGSGLTVDAGCWALDGGEALAYVRARSIEEFIDGQWVPLAAVSPDLARIERQQEFMALALEQVLSVARSDLSRIGEFIEAGSQAVQLDENLTPGDMLDLASAFADYDTSALEVSTVPVAALFSEEGVYQGEEFLAVEAVDLLPFFQGLATTTRPEDVMVSVDTGDDRHIEELNERGFEAELEERTHDGPTRVFLGPDDREQALLLTRYLDSVPTIEVVDIAGVRLAVGPDFSGIRQFPRPLADIAPGLDTELRRFAQGQAAQAPVEAPIEPQAPVEPSVTSIVTSTNAPLPSTSGVTTAEPIDPTTTVTTSSTLVVRGRPPVDATCSSTGGQ